MRFSQTMASLRHGAQRVANATAAAGITVAGVAGAMEARHLYQRARPYMMHSKPGLVRGVDAALATYDAVRGAIGR